MSLKVVGESKKVMYGPRCMLVCGFSLNEKKKLIKKLKKVKKLPIVFTSQNDRQSLMKNMVLKTNHTGLDETCLLERSIILSGVTEKELHVAMSDYKKTKLPKPLWATLTPISENWTVEALVKELTNEHIHIDKD